MRPKVQNSSIKPYEMTCCTHKYIKEQEYKFYALEKTYKFKWHRLIPQDTREQRIPGNNIKNIYRIMSMIK